MNRKDFFKLTGAFGISSMVGLPKLTARENESEFSSNKAVPQYALGMASYTMRNFKPEEVVDICNRLEITRISLKSHHLPLESSDEEIKRVVSLFTNAGIKVYGVGVIYMKTEDEVNKAFAYAKKAGVEMIVGSPLFELLGLVEQRVKETGVKLAIHNHGPEDKVYSSVDIVADKIKNLDRRIGFCIDIGHVVRNNEDPTKMIAKYHDRLLDLHMKDVSEAVLEGKALEVGRGIIDIKSVLKKLTAVGYKGAVAFEYEKDGDHPIPGLSESVGYVKALSKVV